MSDNDDIKKMLSLINDAQQPNCVALNEILRDLPALRWNAKVFGNYLASVMYQGHDLTTENAKQSLFKLSWAATKFDDFCESWFIDTCNQLKMTPLLHRKLWENAYLLKSLETAGKLQKGLSGVGFGCGEEPFPSYFASKGINVLVTDLDPATQAAEGWISTHQHAQNLDKVYKPDFLARQDFDALVSHRYVDMNAIPADMNEKFDFCWSICAFEHLGSIEKGLRFVEQSLKVLKPGGIAIHTTEFNYASDDETIDNWPTVLFRRKDFEQLAERLKLQGYKVPDLSFDVGSSPIDWFIDLPPYPHDVPPSPSRSKYYDKSMNPAHLKLMVDGFPTTCYGIIAQK
jgi:SAM-dependent methyltransferase